MDLEEDWGSVPTACTKLTPPGVADGTLTMRSGPMWPRTRASHDTEQLSFSPTGMHMDMHMH